MSLIRMLKQFNKARICCPVVVYEGINSFFWKEKDPNVTKNQKFPDFQRFYAIFVQFLIDFVD